MAKKKGQSIPNWTMFGVHGYIIEIHFGGYDDDDEPHYMSAIGMFLDNGSKESEPTGDIEKDLYITVFTDFTSSDPKALAWMTLHSFDPDLFGQRLIAINLHEEDDQFIEYDIQEILNMAEETHEDNQLILH